jgi:TM2 domain-containing membrane protein YozV
MSEEQGWNVPGNAPGYQQRQPAAQPYQQPAFDQAYQPSQPLNGYAPAPYQRPYPPGYAAGPVLQVVPKNAGVALLISFFLPGVGSMYAGKTSTGVIILIGYIISWVLTVVIIGFVGVFVFWIWGMINAFQSAQAWNRERGIES